VTAKLLGDAEQPLKCFDAEAHAFRGAFLRAASIRLPPESGEAERQSKPQVLSP